MSIRDKKNILITFDYELFLGHSSGHIDQSLINPTCVLLQILKRNNFKAIFFVDTVYIMRLIELRERFEAIKTDYEKINKQLSDIAKDGHYLYPHIHPHWLDATYHPEKNIWALKNFEKYTFSSIDSSVQTVLFSQSLEILKQIDNNAIIEGYRAGGWSIQPFQAFMPFFEKYNLRYEFSVLPGKYYDSEAQKYDFTNAPVESIYSFSDDVCNEDKTGYFREFTISILELPKIISFLSRKFSVLCTVLKLPFVLQGGDGKTIHLQNVRSGDRYYKGRRRLVASFEDLDPFIFLYQYKIIKKSAYFHFISHPKMLSRMNFFFTSLLLKKLRKRYNIETDFHLFK